MKSLFHIFTLLSFLFFPAIGQSELVAVEEAVEAASVNVTINTKLSGTIYVNPCKKCPRVSFKIKPETQAEHNGKSVHLYKVKELNGKPATVVYDTKSKTAVRIIW